jgi:hypothetical protein
MVPQIEHAPSGPTVGHLPVRIVILPGHCPALMMIKFPPVFALSKWTKKWYWLPGGIYKDLRRPWQSFRMWVF